MNSVETETQVRLPWQKGIPLVWSEFFSSQAFECPICESESLEMRTRNWLKKGFEHLARLGLVIPDKFILGQEKEIRCRYCQYSKKEFFSD